MKIGNAIMGGNISIVKSKASLDLVWKNIHNRSMILNGECLFELDPELVAETLNSYAKLSRARYGDHACVRPSALAGFLADAIMTYRPIVPLDAIQGDSGRNSINATLAIRCGMEICAKYHERGAGRLNRMLLEDRIVREWFRSSLLSLRQNKYSPESLITAFEKLCKRVFPDDFAHITVRL